MTIATLDDFIMRRAEIVFQCCGPLEELTCPQAPRGLSVIAAEGNQRLPIQVTGDELICDCGEPIYSITANGRRGQCCRTAINSMKLDSVQPTDAEPFVFDIEIKYSTDGFVSGVHRHFLRDDVALEEYLVTGRATVDIEGKIHLAPSG